MDGLEENFTQCDLILGIHRMPQNERHAIFGTSFSPQGDDRRSWGGIWMFHAYTRLCKQHGLAAFVNRWRYAACSRWRYTT
jgi:hypothetical protein